MNKLFQTITCSNQDDQEKATQSELPTGGSESNRLLIRDLETDMMIGIHEHELNKKQRVIVNVVMDVDNYDWESDDILDVISYEVIANKIIDLAGSRHFNLVENFAEHIAKICLNDKRCKRVNIRVEKPEAIKQINTVGIEITRLRSS